MNKLKLSKCLWALGLIISFGLTAQQEKQIFYSLTEVSKANVEGLGTPQIIAGNSKVFQIDPAVLLQQMQGVTRTDDQGKGFVARISFPHPDGTMHEYRAMANTVMHPELEAKFPAIKAFDAYDNNGASVKWDITPHGLHVMIRQPGVSTIYIDPLIRGNNQYYIVYYKKDFQTDKTRECAFDSDVEKLKMGIKPTTGVNKSFGSCQLRTYMLALSATGEYTAFHGGTVPLAQAAQVTTINRVNGVYENEMAVTLTFIANNNLIIYTNSGSDPFTNGNAGSMITQNQTNTTTVIGSANYDIGHVFGTNSGGLAGLGVVCNNSNKARGVTGSSAPIGDAFDIDYVAHEIGHQFGCNHTFAGTTGSCNGNGNLATAMEPGSGSTIMAYAGICGALDVQPNSDDNFHGISLQEMGTFVTGSGNGCATVTSLSNNAPVLVSTNGNVTIPAGTAFALTAVATDADGDPLTYNWEQMNNAFTGAVPSATATSGPNFRAKPSTVSPTRYFPALPGTSTTWERLPTVSRTLNFRCVVRDNAPGAGGCNDHEDVTVTVTSTAGPFILNYPSITGISWAGSSSQTVTWAVAGTASAPVACANVDILLSTDGGLTYPTTLISNVPNDGSQVITVPNTATTTARVMVICSNGTFFDVSDNNFTITAPTSDYTLSTTPSTLTVCQPTNATFTINVGAIGGYNSPVTLSVSGVPAGATSNFSTNPVTPVGSSTLTISNTGSAAPGSYTLTVTANGTTGTKTSTLTLVIASGAPSAVTLLTPTNGATGVAVPVNFTWSTAVGATYDINIATDAGFSTIVDQATGLVAASYSSPGLVGGTQYYWRVRAVSGCGTSAWSSTFNFTPSNCATFASTNVPLAVGAASVTSVINIASTGTITDLNVASLDISHVYVGDLSATLTSPAGTVVQLFTGPGIPASTYGCAGDNVVVSFDDAAALTATNLENMCNASPPAITGAFQSINPLSVFNGETMTGTWTLTVLDSYTAGDNGTLNSWSLNICSSVACTAPTVPTVSGSATICPGASATLSISSGSLNNATDWEWYSGSCGGTVVGTGTSITVSPGAPTTYYVRGTGGCVTPGTCASFTVSPVDNTPPTLTCPGTQTVSLGASCNATLPNYITMASATDACDATPTLTQSPPAGTTISATTVVTILATDDNGNNTSCNFTVNVVDNTDPSLTCPAAQTTCGTTIPDFTGLASATDNCGTPTITQSPSAGSAFTASPTTITLTATDAAGNTTTCNLILTGGVSNSSAAATICVGDTYTFPDGTTGTSSQVYTSVLTSSAGCDSIIVTTLNVVTTIDASVTQSGATLSANASGLSYQWIDCDNGNAAIAGATSQSFTPSATVGNYAVIVSGGSCTDTSACFTVDFTGVDELGAGFVQMFPNPASDQVTLAWEGEVNRIELTDAQGKLVYRAENIVGSSHIVPLVNISAGLYFVRVQGDQGPQVLELIKE